MSTDSLAVVVGATALARQVSAARTTLVNASLAASTAAPGTPAFVEAEAAVEAAAERLVAAKVRRDAHAVADALDARCTAARLSVVRLEAASAALAAELRAASEELVAAKAAVVADPVTYQRHLDRISLVLGLAVNNGYWREIDGCVVLCKDFGEDSARDGLLHLTMHFAAKNAARANAAYKGSRTNAEGPPHQFTRLHQAARKGRASRVAVLLAAGADVNSRNYYGATPLTFAKSFQPANLHVIKLLEAAGGKPY